MTRVQRDYVRDQQNTMKYKGKIYSGRRCQSRLVDIKAEDYVLLKQNKINKLSTPFRNALFKIRSNRTRWVRYKRNVTHAKKYLSDGDHDSNLPHDTANFTDCDYCNAEDFCNDNETDDCVIKRHKRY